MICCQLCSTHHQSVQIELKSSCVIKVASITIRKNFCYKEEAITTITESTLFIVSKYEWNTKEGTGKSMKNELYVQWYAKGIFQA